MPTNSEYREEFIVLHYNEPDSKIPFKSHMHIPGKRRLPLDRRK